MAKAKSAKSVSVRAVAPRRADYGKSPSLALSRMSPHLRPIAEKLQKLIEAAAPDAKAALKWGQPVYSIGTKMMAMIGAHKAHVNLVVVGPAKDFRDPKARLVGSSEGGRHIKLTDVKEVPASDVTSWVKTAAAYARAHTKAAKQSTAKAGGSKSKAPTAASKKSPSKSAKK